MTLAELLCAAFVALALPNADEACYNMEVVVDAAERYNVDPAVMVSLIHVESRWVPTAVSRDGACGLTQILPKYTKRSYKGKVTCKQLFDTELSIYKGTDILGKYLKRYRRNYKRSLCSYNAGPRRCRPNAEENKGHRYANKVMRLARKIRRKVKVIEREEREMEDIPGCYE